MKNYVRLLGFIEALSLIALLFIAMPIKYLGGNPEPVRWVGTAHGMLFLVFVLGATLVALEESWTKRRLLLSYVASCLPFGPFIFDRKIFY